MECLTIRSLKTRIFRHGEDLEAFILESVPRELISEGSVLAVTSKIASLAERRSVPTASIDKMSLVRREADHFLGEVGYGCALTIKEGLFIPSAGIDESNSETGDYLLYPVDPFATAKQLWQGLRKAWGLSNLGVVLTDSHTTPLRKGVTGISLSHFGFRGVRDMIGTQDLFGRELKMTTINAADALAGAAVFAMGEGAESRPLAWIKGAEIEFTEDTLNTEVRMPLKEDLYYPFFRSLLSED
jgi:F420-0:gamma-glutamyl ligase